MTTRSTPTASTLPSRLLSDDRWSVAAVDRQAGAAAGAAAVRTPLTGMDGAGVLPGKLGSDSAGSMALHTREALRVFSGRAANAKAGIVPLPGGRHYAAALKSIWYLSGADNPYADWILIRAYDGLVTLRARLTDLTAAREATLAQLRHKGLVLDVLASARPVTVVLGFRSPYGFAIAETIAEFDYYVRLMQTLVRTDRLSDAEGVTDIQALSQSLFALYRKAARWERLLLGKLRQLRRDDFRPEAGADARQRVAAAAAQLGPLPRDILLGIEQPRHSRRRVHAAFAKALAVSPAEAAAADLTESPGLAGDETGGAEVKQPAPSAGVAADVSRETHDTGAPAAPAGQ